MSIHTTHTTQAWWESVKRDPAAFQGWLLDQYRGEATAGERIERLRDGYAAPGTRAARVLSIIAEQERKHAGWVGELLRARGVEPRIEPEAERYWPEMLPGIHDLESGCAVGAHAEKMRLDRIEHIARDPEAPADVRAVFARILPEERFHERAFRALAGDAAMRATEGAHELGRLALGLSA
jgi:rubrerythrin